MKIYFILIFIFTSTILIAQWERLNPLPIGDQIKQVLFIDSQTGWMVPYNPTLLKTTDGGLNWQQIPTNIIFNNLFFLDKNEGWGIGRVNYVNEMINDIYHTTDGGLSWEKQIANTRARFNIFFIDKSNGWATTSTLDYSVIHTSDGGITWNKQAESEFDLTDSARKFYVMFTDSLKGWIIGGKEWSIKTTDGGNSWQRDSTMKLMYKMISLDSLNLFASTTSKSIAKSKDGGNSWVFTSVETSAEDLFALDTNRIFAATSTGFLGTTNGGSSWSKYSGQQMNSFYFISDDEVWGGGLISGLTPSIVHSTDAGYSWDDLVKTNELIGFDKCNDVDFVDENVGWIILSTNKLLKTTDGGESWFEQQFSSTNLLNEITMLNEQVGYIAGQNGILLKTTNGGSSWVLQNSNTDYDLMKMSFLNESNGWVVGPDAYYGVILKTTNGGESWDEVGLGNNIGKVDVCFIDTLNGWAVGYDDSNQKVNLYRTRDGGSNWTFLTENNYINVNQSLYHNTITFVDSLRGISYKYYTDNTYVNGNTIVYLSTDGGMNWIQTQEIENAIFNKIKFVNKNTGWLVGYGGVIYRTTDSGQSWEKQPSYTLNTLNSVDFIDENTGWIVGSKGTVLHTTNGGVTSVENLINIENVPDNFILYQNYPNPFNPSTTISYVLPYQSLVEIIIYDIMGREIRSYIIPFQSAGYNSLVWDGRNNFGNTVTSGVYFYKISINSLENNASFTKTAKMLMVK